MNEGNLRISNPMYSIYTKWNRYREKHCIYLFFPPIRLSFFLSSFSLFLSHFVSFISFPFLFLFFSCPIFSFPFFSSFPLFLTYLFPFPFRYLWTMLSAWKFYRMRFSRHCVRVCLTNRFKASSSRPLIWDYSKGSENWQSKEERKKMQKYWMGSDRVKETFSEWYGGGSFCEFSSLDCCSYLIIRFSIETKNFKRFAVLVI